MFQIQRSMYTETSHLLVGHEGGCKNIHGHSYKWTVIVQSEELTDGMVMDFTELKKKMNAVIMPYDHALVLDNETYWILRDTLTFRDMSIVNFYHRPTAEAMAKQVYEEMSILLPEGVEMVMVSCRETENNEAVYYA